jgi:hypothetical protein
MIPGHVRGQRRQAGLREIRLHRPVDLQVERVGHLGQQPTGRLFTARPRPLSAVMVLFKVEIPALPVRLVA